ncbi:MAG: cysteine hydrolase [Armatimonadetes bacterium]|nr:cysteine hydrolase [Armatimonadota bacterium]MDW8121287.1 isochorismatase family cysteine hydrolase [Armatimonadota bacterium]
MAPKTVTVPEYQETDQVTLDPKTTALVIVDMQNDFVKEGGRLVVPAAAATVPAIARLLKRAREHQVTVAYTQDSHLPGDPEFPIWGEHCLVGTWGWEIVEELKPEPGDFIFPKRRYDGFYGTNMEHDLRVKGVQNLIVTGTVANICVLHTAGSAALRWFHIIVPKDGVSALNDFDMESALRQIHFLYRGIITTCDGIQFA